MIVGAAVAGLVLVPPGGVPAYPQANKETHIPVSRAHSSKFLGFLKS